MRIKIDEAELLSELKMAYRQFLKAHNITKDDMIKKYGITGEHSDITELLKIMEKRGEVYEENGKFYLTEEGKVRALGRKLPSLDSNSIRDLLKLAKDDHMNDKVMMYFEVLNEFFGRMKGKEDRYPAHGTKVERSKFETDSFQTLDNNLFKSMYSAMSSIDNFKRSDVEMIGVNEKPVETIKIALSHMFNDDTKVFHCSDHVAEMLTLTNNKIYHRMLPFRCIFVDVNFSYKDKIQFWGMLLTAVRREKDGIVYYLDDDEPEGFHVFAMGIDNSDSMIMYAFTTIFKDGLWRPDRDDKVTHSLAQFACNFLDFINDPSVQYMKASESHGRAHKILRRIYAEDKMIDLDKTYFVRIENPLRHYVDNYIRMRTKHNLSFRFWVRGHFRTLHSDRYGDKVGTRLWIAPYIKGQGVLIKKEYDVGKGSVAPNHRVIKTEELVS